jgi:1-acyl-sn-glycerol-3-phosphate acyltransferase
MRTLFAKFVTLHATFVFASLVLVAQLLRLRQGRGSVFDMAPRWWARWIAWSAGMRVVTHGREAIDASQPHIYVANHVSIMDIPAILHSVPDHGFVAKRELSRVPLFGPAARAVGVVYIDRENRKSAFAAYEEAADNVRAGRSVIVFPEGTRGAEYGLREFKKGPFVLAIRSGVPIIPVIIHGTIEVTPNGTLDVTPGTVNIHLLEPVPTAGLSYDDRNVLAETVRGRMAEAMASRYGVSPALIESRRGAASVAASPATGSGVRASSESAAASSSSLEAR